MVIALPSPPAFFSAPTAVTPNDAVDLPEPGPLFVALAGNVSFDCNGVTFLVTAAAAGTLIPFRVTRVRATSTTATVIRCA